jgi:hypothetical protein
MSFDDFKGIWKVIEVDDEDPTETLGHWIAIGGTPRLVKVICINDKDGHTYPDMTYQEEPEMLIGINSTSKITRKTGANEIRYDGGLAPGSWTAEDNLG